MDNNNQLSSANSPEPAYNPAVTNIKPIKKKRVVKLESEEMLDVINKNPLRQTENAKAFINRLVPYSLRTSIAKELLDNNKTVRYVVKYTGLSNEIVMQIKKGYLDSCNTFVEQIKKDESGKITYLANSILDSVNQTDLNKASLLQKITSASILIDKRRLLDGESTENVNYLGKLDVLVNNAERSRAVLDKIKSAGNK